ncbi:MAG: DNA polymerase III subunit beta [Gammaproteobacteria bacterium]|uniref:Beta sliding clamp n=1 Tax=Candidatus Thiopontia autotrophica TaxID=2841688 RepID=A0A8J6NWI6_9GAMM|nr:DNA polymerase III subunit beta [Candidatus Thiopontia autotrophica]MBL6968879.1 DNA polymerase III subunit beta [Gammaproteobacteria bacterium]
MKFSILRENLLQPLQSISGAVEKRQTLPILSHIFVDVSDDSELTLIGTDLEVEIKITIQVTGEFEPGTTTIPARKFSDLSKALPDESEIKVEINKSRAAVRSGKSRFTLSTLSAGDFPRVDEISEVASIDELSHSALKNLLQKSQFSMAMQDVRYYLNGLLLELEGKELRLVATDGHRLAFCRRTLNQDYGEKKQVIIPRKAVHELMRLLDDSDQPVKLILGSNHLQAVLGELTLTTKLIDGRFPDYQRVIPREGKRTLVTNNENFRKAVSRVSILSNEKYRGIRMAMSESVVTIHANNPEQEEAEEELSVQYSGEPMEIGFNSAYMMDALSVISDDEVTIYFIDENSSSLIHTQNDLEEYKFVVMPMRL